MSWYRYVRNKGNPDLVCEKNMNHAIKPGLNVISQYNNNSKKEIQIDKYHLTKVKPV